MPKDLDPSYFKYGEVGVTTPREDVEALARAILRHEWTQMNPEDYGTKLAVAYLGVQARLEQAERALREIANYQGKVARPLRMKKIARAALASTEGGER